MTTLSTGADSVSQSNLELKKWCEYNKVEFHETTLHDLEEFKFDSGFIFTGDKKDELNNGNPKHWLAIYGNYVFDSYGARDYKIPQQLQFMDHSPKRLQAYDSAVCGPYCALFLETAKTSKVTEDELGNEFVHRFSLGNNPRDNDSKILREYLQRAPESVKEETLKQADDEGNPD